MPGIYKQIEGSDTGCNSEKWWVVEPLEHELYEF